MWEKTAETHVMFRDCDGACDLIDIDVQNGINADNWKFFLNTKRNKDAILKLLGGERNGWSLRSSLSVSSPVESVGSMGTSSLPHKDKQARGQTEETNVCMGWEKRQQVGSGCWNLKDLTFDNSGPFWSCFVLFFLFLIKNYGISLVCSSQA